MTDDDIVYVGFSKRDIRKLASFCVKNKIRVYSDDKRMDWNKILLESLNSPVIEKVVDAILSKDNGPQDKVIDVEYEETTDKKKKAEQDG